MGQYYNAYVYQNHHETVISPDSGLKLMEHSWMLNNLSMLVARKIYNYPASIAWVGDYSDKTWAKDFVKEHERFPVDWHNRVYKQIYNRKDDSALRIRGDVPVFDYRNKFLVNHTRREFFSFNDYINGRDLDGDWVIFPLSLLTACGNGLGGGDYHGLDEEKCGAWAYDSIEITDNMPADYVFIPAPFFSEDV